MGSEFGCVVSAAQFFLLYMSLPKHPLLFTGFMNKNDNDSIVQLNPTLIFVSFLIPQ